MMLQATLEIAGVSKSFGGIDAVADMSFSMAPGEVTALIGPNGAGKTTLINLLTGVLTADRGTIRLDGRDLAGTPAYVRARAGIARTYQTPQMAQGMSVLMNVMAARNLPKRWLTALASRGRTAYSSSRPTTTTVSMRRLSQWSCSRFRTGSSLW